MEKEFNTPRLAVAIFDVRIIDCNITDSTSTLHGPIYNYHAVHIHIIINHELE